MQCVLESWSICLLNCNFCSCDYSKVICSFLCDILCLQFSELRYFYSFFCLWYIQTHPNSNKYYTFWFNLGYWNRFYHLPKVIYTELFRRKWTHSGNQIIEILKFSDADSVKVYRCWVTFFWFVDWTQLYFKWLLKGDKSPRNMRDRTIN